MYFNLTLTATIAKYDFYPKMNHYYIYPSPSPWVPHTIFFLPNTNHYTLPYQLWCVSPALLRRAGTSGGTITHFHGYSSPSQLHSDLLFGCSVCVPMPKLSPRAQALSPLPKPNHTVKFNYPATLPSPSTNSTSSSKSLLNLTLSYL